jgi:hypothetical protein
MKITKTQLKQIIKEELAEGRWESDYGGDWEGGEPPLEDPRGDLRAELHTALDIAGPPFNIQDVLEAADRAAEVSRGADEAIYKALAVLFRSKKRIA